MSDPLVEVGQLLEEAGVAYALIGGHAVNVYAEPRVTQDVDVTVATDLDGMRRLRDTLDRAGFRLEREHGAAGPSGPDFQRYVRDEPPSVLELQSAKTDFQREVVRRAGGGPPRVATPEDLLVLKLIADHPKDLADLFALLALPDLDHAYVERWARDWGVEERLRRIETMAARPSG